MTLLMLMLSVMFAPISIIVEMLKFVPVIGSRSVTFGAVLSCMMKVLVSLAFTLPLVSFAIMVKVWVPIWLVLV